MNPSTITLEQGENGGIYLLHRDKKTLLSLKQLFELGIDLAALPTLRPKTMVSFYAGQSSDPFRGTLQYGLLPGDKIVKEYKGSLIVETGGVIQIVDPEFAARFVVDLDDSRSSGGSTLLGLSYEDQLEGGHRLVDFTFQAMILALLGPTAGDHS